MGLTNRKFKNDAGVGSSRRDDRTGVFWILLQDVKEETSSDGLDYLKRYAVTVRVIEEGDGEQDVGDETTQAYFPSAKATFFETETRQLVQACQALTDEEATAIPTLNPGDVRLKKDSILKRLLKDKVWEGVVLEIRAKVYPKKDKPDETYTRVKLIRRVSKAELLQFLSAKEIKRYFGSNGVPDDPEGLDAPDVDEDEDEPRLARRPRDEDEDEEEDEEEEDEDEEEEDEDEEEEETPRKRRTGPRR